VEVKEGRKVGRRREWSGKESGRKREKGNVYVQCMYQRARKYVGV
jgi:hypothetical protein